MHYIIVDLELNSKAYKGRLPNEIIEIGAVKLNQTLEVDDSFQSFVKPKFHKKLFPLIKRKTHISQQEINDARSFREVLSEFRHWMGDGCLICTWGNDDIHHLKSNCRLNNMSGKWLDKSFDIQKEFSKIHHSPPGQRFSLINALSAVGIKPSEDLHRAYTDARYTAELFIKVFDAFCINCSEPDAEVQDGGSVV